MRNLELYVDDMLIKFKNLDDHLADLEENFIIMKNSKVRINLAKCVFGGNHWKVLRFHVNEKRD